MENMMNEHIHKESHERCRAHDIDYIHLIAPSRSRRGVPKFVYTSSMKEKRLRENFPKWKSLCSAEGIAPAVARPPKQALALIGHAQVVHHRSPRNRQS